MPKLNNEKKIEFSYEEATIMREALDELLRSIREIESKAYWVYILETLLKRIDAEMKNVGTK